MKTEPYLIDTPDFILRITAAARRTAEMDRADRAAGHALPAEGGLSLLLRTAVAALAAAHAERSWDAAGEAAFLVLQAEHLARQLEAKVEILVRHPGGSHADN